MIVNINVKEVINKSIAMSTEDGEKLFHILFDELSKGNSIELSFEDISILISHFLNESIGKLYEKFSNWDILDKAIAYKHIDKDDLELLYKKVIPTAKSHYSNIEKSKQIELDII